MPSMSRAGAPRRWPRRRGLARPEEDRLEGLAGADDGGPVARRQQLVQRVVLEIAGEQAREPLGRQVDLLEQVRLAAGEAEPLEVERRRAGLQVERRRRPLTGRLGPGRDQARLRVEAALLHLVGEAGRLAMSRSRRGWRTNVPRPRVRSMRPSRASSSSARRTVIRLQP